ncbi:hypothetical protein SKUL_51 [Pseudomonas phage Skulduggery]|uniref:Uncharacterized protein n=1 Tax=Pseudomonas phage Skulduggery TaxID=2006671 RepID=A0A1Y0SUT8_9CAUD|nr:hypothetical protein PP627_gp51 [Pseudomonas phage Skulduggery]ARV77150.1 hypothetical protein SKUL_51 [Pseudomonas phage Skulduggery]
MRNDNLPYADTSQARQGDMERTATRYITQEERQANGEAFALACKERRDRERIASRARIAGALDQLEAFFGSKAP